MSWTCKKCGVYLPGINPAFVTCCPACKGIVGEKQNVKQASKTTNPSVKKTSSTQTTARQKSEIIFTTPIDHDLERSMFVIMLLSCSGMNVSQKIWHSLLLEFYHFVKEWTTILNSRNAEWSQQTSEPMPYVSGVNQVLEEIEGTLRSQDIQIVIRLICKRLVLLTSPSKILFLTAVATMLEPLFKGMNFPIKDPLLHVLILAGTKLLPEEVDIIKSRYQF